MNKSPTMTSLVPNKVQNESWPFHLLLLNHQLFPINIFFYFLFNHPLPPPPPPSIAATQKGRHAPHPPSTDTRFTTIISLSGFRHIFDYRSDQTQICFTDSCLLCVEELSLLYKMQLQYRLSRSPAEHSGVHPLHALH